MSLPETISAYNDCEDRFQKAFDDAVGARFSMPTYASARLLQMRLHQYRALLRKESRRTYDKTDPRYDKSEYDGLIVKVPIELDGKWWVYIRRHGQEIIDSESLSEVENE